MVGSSGERGRDQQFGNFFNSQNCAPPSLSHWLTVILYLCKPGWLEADTMHGIVIFDGAKRKTFPCFSFDQPFET